jgi:hypothetical protein
MNKKSASGNNSLKPIPGSIRLIISVTGGELHLIRKQKIAMKAPPPDLFPVKTGISGSWIELRHDNGTILYSRMIHDSFNDLTEVRSEEPGEPVSWINAKGIKRTLVILVPDLPGAKHLAVLSRAAGEKRDPEEKARFAVNE